MSIRFVDLHYKGIRIQQGWRHLKTDVYFVILFVMTMVSLLCASAMPVFEQAMSGRDWEHLAGILLKVLLAGLALWMFCLVVRSRKELADARVIREELYGEKEKG